MAIHDILYCVLRESWSHNNTIRYDTLKRKTGLAKRTIGRYVTELEDHQIVSRLQEGHMFVRITDFAKKHISPMLNSFRTEAEIQADIEERKRERKAARGETQQTGNQDSTTTEEGMSPTEVALKHSETGGGSMWTPLSETSIAVSELPQLVEIEELAERDVAIRST
jgi:DNA-binding HxlR family transcriptional regulator